MNMFTPAPKKRSYLLPPGCKNLSDLLPSISALKLPSGRMFRVNGKIRAPEVRVIREQDQQLASCYSLMLSTWLRLRGLILLKLLSTRSRHDADLLILGSFATNWPSNASSLSKDGPEPVAASPHWRS
jgi:hypothetical protein